MTNNPNRTRLAALAVLLVGAFALAGCAQMGGEAEKPTGNDAPVARLDSDRTTGYVGDVYTFDAQGSNDPDGNVTRWTFDFGDGNKTTVTSEDFARVKHVYADGGQYDVTVTVADNGDDEGNGEKTDIDSLTVAVDERTAVLASVADSPVSENETDTDDYELPLDVNSGADRIEVELELQSVLPAGTTDVLVQVLEGDTVLREETHSLTAGESTSVDFDAIVVDDDKPHKLLITAETGGATAAGEARTVYSDVMA